MKTRSIKLGKLPDKSDYQVISVKNSTEYSPGEILKKIVVDDMCRHTHWDVTVVPLREQT